MAPHPRLYLTTDRLARIRAQHLAVNSYEWRQLTAVAGRNDLDGVRAQSLIYAVTGDETVAKRATDNLRAVMAKQPELRMSFNKIGWTFHIFALAYDWLYPSPHFDAALKQRVLDYVNAVPIEGKGKWNRYPEQAYFNGGAKVIWGPPLWGLATHGDNPRAEIYIDNGYRDRWSWIRIALGFGPDNLAVARGGCLPEGMDYGSGTIANLFLYVEAMLTATGEDLYTEAPALRQYLEYFIKSYYYSPEYLRHPEHGHNARKGDGYLTAATIGLLIGMDHYCETREGRWAAWWMNNIAGASEHPGKNVRYGAAYDVIFSDGSIPEQSPFSEPLAYFAEGNGMWICRSNWSEGISSPQTFATFRAGNWVWFNQNHWDQGNYCIYSHGEDLLVDAGIYDGGGGKSVINYHGQTIAHNCVTIEDPKQTKGWHYYRWMDPGFENTGGQNVPYRETRPGAILDGVPKQTRQPRLQGEYLHDMSDILRRAHNERYTYAFADLTNAYANKRWREDYESRRLSEVDFSPKVKSVTRHWLYLRGTESDPQEYFVTFDRVQSTKAAFQKKSLLHFIGEPVPQGGSVADVDIEGGIETWRADRWRIEIGGASLQGAILLPKAPLVRKVGGVGREYWVNGSNYDPFPDRANAGGGVWRLEIMPPKKQEEDLFFVVLAPGARGNAAFTAKTIAAKGARGAHLGIWTLMFADRERYIDEVLYHVDASGPRHHLICDLEPGGLCSVYVNGSTQPLVELRVGVDGIAEFESVGEGEFKIICKAARTR